MGRPSRRPGNLAAESTTFVGRQRELAELKRTLGVARLVTLVGPGGVGKTRLATRLGAEVARGFRDGVWLVQLAELDEPALVPNAVLSALDLRDQTAAAPLGLLLSYLRDRELLLVIDSCEHLLDAAASIAAQIIASAPSVKLIATSREPLSVHGEHVRPVPPLEVPDVAGASVHDDAVDLFVDRAVAASGRFELTDDNRPAVAELCRRLDGLPLAIELAAVRTRALSVKQILDRLTDRFALLTAGSRSGASRHQTLRTAIDWSYGLLTDQERAVLRRLAVFAGSFALEAVEAVCEPAPRTDVLAILSSLVDKSLVVKQDLGRSARYRLHESMREFARLQLRSAAEEADALERHSAYFATISYRPLFEEPNLAEWLESMDAEIDDVRSLLQRRLEEGDHSGGAAHAAGLAWYWGTRATTEGVRWLDQFLSHADAGPAVLARAYFVRGFLATMQVDTEAAINAFSQADELARTVGDFGLLAFTLAAASLAHNLAADHARAAELADEVSRLADSRHDPIEVAMAAQAQGFNAVIEGDLKRGQAMYSKAAATYRTHGLLYGLGVCLLHEASARFAGGELDASRALLAEALSIARRLDDRVAQWYLLEAFGCHAAASGDAALAARLLGAGERIRQEVGAQVFFMLWAMLDPARESASATLGSARFEAELQAGARLSRQEAMALALGEPAAPASRPPTDGDAAVLGKRESDIARLVGEGLSNKAIGARLFISDRTVESHVRSIMNKLGFSSRAQIAGWIASR